ncbi:NAD(P)-dependent oxidoreductase [Streptomyces sp. NPDC004732]|uniref:NAD-dependent epimerase/dehydratase family protein n=1 Tax=Streptomyces sp. NPDC004732 TaxID=3154290 RepID=UPI0033BABE1E
MRVLVAGATGVIGRQLTGLLADKGHEVIALARNPERAAASGSGVRAVRADALDAEGLSAAVVRAEPEAVVNLLTAIPRKVDSRRLDRDFAATNLLRTRGTRNLVDAAKAAGVQRMVGESVAFGYRPAPDGGLRDETSPLWTTGPEQFRPVVAALRELEERTTGEGGTVLRFGHLYGPGSAFDREGNFTQQVRKRMLPLVGEGNAVFSFIHAQDAAAAVLKALEGDADVVRGATYNIVDDDPAPVSAWLPELARVLGAKAPMRVPVWLVRPMIGSYGVAFMNELQGADNGLAARGLGWQPSRASWREGFAAELGASTPNR